MRKLIRFGAGAVAVAALLTTGATTATASTGPGGWEPTKTDPFVFAAGALCPFELKGDILYDREFTRVTERNADGTPKVEEFAGALGIRFSGNGRSVDRDLTGLQRLHHEPDGTRVFELYGNNVAPVYPPSKSFPPGDYVTNGYFVFVVHADKSREYTVQQGRKEDLCRTLG